MNKNGNGYIILYAAVMVVVVAAVLSFVALSLGGIQAKNVRIEKMEDILRSVGEAGDADRAPDKAAYITAQYKKYIVDSYAVNVAGDRIQGADAFDLLNNLKREYDKPLQERELPVFVSRNDQGVVSYVIPVWGTGLWGPVWGYIALADNWDTIDGAVFDHKSETPGLGAEIATPAFQEQFIGKHILGPQGNVVAITLQKGGADPDNPYAVDALTGGTLTSRGVEDMLKNCLGDYQAYIRKQRAAADEVSTGMSGSGESVPAAATTDSVTAVSEKRGAAAGAPDAAAVRTPGGNAGRSTDKSDRHE